MNRLWVRLLVGTTLSVAAVLVVAGALLYGLVEQSLLEETDRALLARARLLASTVEQEGRFLDLEFEELDMRDFASPDGGAFLELRAEEGRLLYRSGSLGDAGLPPAPASARPSARWVELPGGTRGRVAALAFGPRLEGPGTPRRLTLTLAQDAGGVDEALTVLLGLLCLVGGVTLVVIGAVLAWVVRRSLRPLDVLVRQIAEIGSGDLSVRLSLQGVPAELVGVVARINELLGRLSSAFQRERSFSDDVAHELRTPLAGLRTLLEVTATRRRSEDEYAEAVEGAAVVVDQLQSMVDRLLELARLETRRGGADEVVDLLDLLPEVWAPFAEAAAGRGLRVEWELPPRLSVRGDRALLQLVFRNLYDNAVSYADAAGRIRITGRRDAERVRLEVANSGSRLTQEQAALATQRFWRGDAARTEAATHCGLGLSLVERAVRALDGDLQLRSEQGSDFEARVELRAEREPSLAPPELVGAVT